MTTKIEWCDETINPIQDRRKGTSGRGYHCTKCSPGCDHCYAERINLVRGNGQLFDDSPVEFEMIEKELRKLLRWKKSRSVFVQSMGDLFHEDVPDDIFRDVLHFIDLSRNHDHIVLILTKRPRVMLAKVLGSRMDPKDYPHIYWGLTICNQGEADRLIPIFLQVPGRKFLSIEPMLGSINIEKALCSCPWPEDAMQTRHLLSCPADIRRPGISKRWPLDAVILGGETGPGARPMHPDWVRSVRDQCADAGVPFFFKGWGKWVPVREFYLDRPHRLILDNGYEHVICDKDYRVIDGQPPPDAWVMIKGKSRLLDGREHNDLPWRKA